MRKAPWAASGAVVSSLLAVAVAVVSLVGCAGAAISTGPLFPDGEHDSVCGPAARYAEAAVSQPIEITRGEPVRVVAVEMGHASNVRVHRVGVGPLPQDYFLIGRSAGSEGPQWSEYAKSFTVTPTRPGLAVAEVQVIDRSQDASAGPFIVTYESGGRRYRSDAVLSYRIPKGSCD